MAALRSDALLDEIAERTRIGDRVVLVHGGGPHIDAALLRQGATIRRVAGLRVTDADTLAITESVLCGSVNKALVRALLARGVRAAGICGEDGALLVARFSGSVDGVSLGFVGEIECVNAEILESLLAARIVPVVAPLGVTADFSTALNVNADIAAGAIAAALGADVYLIVTNVARVRRVADDPSTEIVHLTSSQARRYLDDGTFDGGMRPKIESVLSALRGGARSAIVTGSGPAALSAALAGNGTTIVNG